MHFKKITLAAVWKMDWKNTKTWERATWEASTVTWERAYGGPNAGTSGQRDMCTDLKSIWDIELTGHDDWQDSGDTRTKLIQCDTKSQTPIQKSHLRDRGKPHKCSDMGRLQINCKGQLPLSPPMPQSLMTNCFPKCLESGVSPINLVRVTGCNILNFKRETLSDVQILSSHSLEICSVFPTHIPEYWV